MIPQCKQNKIHEIILEEDVTSSITIPVDKLSEKYRIEITGVVNNTEEGYGAIRASSNSSGCNSGIMRIADNQMTVNNFSNHWGCFVQRIKTGYVHTFIDVVWNPMYNGFAYTSSGSCNSIANNTNISSFASGAQYNTGKNYNLQLFMPLRAGAKIKIINM